MKYILLSVLFVLNGFVGRSEHVNDKFPDGKIYASKQHRNLSLTVTVSSNIRSSFVSGGRLLLHLTKKNEKTPRNNSEITIGFTPANWNPSNAISFSTKDVGVLKNKFEKLNDVDTGKYYYQVVYKQNIDDGNENVEGNIFSNVDSFELNQ